MLVAYPVEADVFLDGLARYLFGKVGQEFVALRHAAIIGLLRSVPTLYRIDASGLCGLPLECPEKYIPIWVCNRLHSPVSGDVANEQGTVLVEFIRVMSNHSMINRFGEELNKVVKNSVATPGKNQFIDTYFYKKTGFNDQKQKLDLIHPIPTDPAP